MIDPPEFEVVDPREPYGELPSLPNGGEFLGWYVSSDKYEYNDMTILLSDVCHGEPEMREIVRVISHEYLHHILNEVVSVDVCHALDNIVCGAKFIADREENTAGCNREMEERWREEDERLKNLHRHE